MSDAPEDPPIDASGRSGARTARAAGPRAGRPAPGLDHDEFSAAVTSVTSAFGDPTRRDIYLLIRDAAAGVTAGEVAERFELHPNVARHHLEKLTAGGYLVVAVGRADGAPRRAARRSSTASPSSTTR